MTNRLIIACILALLQVGCAHLKASQDSKVTLGQDKSSAVKEIDREAALRIAREDASKKLRAMEDYGITDCQQGSFWRVYFESLNLQHSPLLFEVIVNKKGVVLDRRELASTIGLDQSASKSPQSTEIGRAEAINIAEKDAARIYGRLTKFTLTVCELKRSWRIIYAPDERLNGGGPEYLVDKITGRILDKKYYQ